MCTGPLTWGFGPPGTLTTEIAQIQGPFALILLRPEIPNKPVREALNRAGEVVQSAKLLLTNVALVQRHVKVRLHLRR